MGKGIFAKSLMSGARAKKLAAVWSGRSGWLDAEGHGPTFGKEIAILWL